ncbi:MCE family protein [Candidatus Poribacteria bacterium]|nr:MCE family protein [Candidatus Poribacteria bacterium]MYB66748.1 MCE family protein [Candidatus Poribacteria bacterium]MYF54947.1 MCE family protein [Candidatus Poribacteria bacterium]
MKFWNTSAKVGFMVLVAIILLAILLINSSNWPWSTRGDDLTFKFRNVNGLYVGSGVYLSGVNIGRVTSIELNPETDSVEIRASVKNAYQWLRKGCDARISMSGFVGETYIALNNGDIGNPSLQQSDLPIIGIDPVNPLELLEQTSSGLSKAIDLTSSANELLQSSQEEIQQGVKETRALVAQTSRTLEKFNENMDKTVDTFMKLTSDYDVQLEKTLINVNELLIQFGNETSILSSQINDIGRSLMKSIDQNSPKVNAIFTDIQRSASDFRSLATEFRKETGTISSEVSDFIAKSSSFIDKSSSEITPVLDKLQTAATTFITLEKNITELLNTIQHGEGTVAQLLNNPEPFTEVKETLNSMSEMFTGLKEIYEQTDRQLKGFKFPSLSSDVELRYLSLEENLHTELGFSLNPQSKSRYRVGVGIRDEITGFELQYGYNFTDYLRGRFGFIRSKFGAGFDLSLWERRIGLGIESFGLTSDRPELNAELSFRFYRGAHLLLGVEDWWHHNRRWTTGIRFITSDW